MPFLNLRCAVQYAFLPLVCTLLFGACLSAEPRRRNVLLICVDDLRNCLTLDGDSIAHTPHLDRLASEGRYFRHHYVQVAACGPSRGSMLTGRRILRSWDIWNADRRSDKEPSNPVSLAHHFRRHGYETVSIGKISHEPGGTMPPAYETHQVPFSWDKAFVPIGRWASPWHAFFAYSNGHAYNAAIKWVRDEPPRLPFENADVGDDAFADHFIAEAGIAELHRLAEGSKPFLLAVGFFKPHLPHNAPKQYWDSFPPDRVGMPDNFHPPKKVDPEICIHKSPELTVHYQWPSGPGNISTDEAVRQRQAYYAAVAYVDRQIGTLVDALRQLPCYENTVVALWSDHGWQLGEHHMFSKHTNYEVATNSPLILRIPDMPQPGVPADGLVESIDLYPTLTELCNLPTPRGLAGTSLVSAVQQPDAECRESAYSAASGGKGYHGHSLRTRDYRLVRWIDKKGAVGMVELYDCHRDPGENKNVAADHPDIVTQLSRQLAAKMDEVVQTSH